VVPAAAVQRSSKGSFVYVVKEDRTVEVQPVSVGPGEKDLVSVDEGVKPGELVVVEGVERLRAGSKVEVQTQGVAGVGKGK
jgi:multidrug efflux system membrane fusion protein